jgi:cysteine synthase
VSRPQPPSEAASDAAWERIMSIAREHALVIGGAGGVVTLATVAVQREEGLRARVLRTHGMDHTGEQEELPL